LKNKNGTSGEMALSFLSASLVYYSLNSYYQARSELTEQQFMSSFSGVRSEYRVPVFFVPQASKPFIQPLRWGSGLLSVL
jgi:aminopeptidase C